MSDDKITRLRERLDRANKDCARLAHALAKARKRQAIVRRDLVKAKEALASPPPATAETAEARALCTCGVGDDDNLVHHKSWCPRDGLFPPHEPDCAEWDREGACDCRHDQP